MNEETALLRSPRSRESNARCLHRSTYLSRGTSAITERSIRQAPNRIRTLDWRPIRMKWNSPRGGSDKQERHHQIEQMVIIARRSTQDLKPSNDPAYRLLPVGEHESLKFSLGDILDKVSALKDDWDDTE